jgi:hypothetical protein
MYGGLRRVKRRISILFLVGIDRRTLCFGRFLRQRGHSDALHQFANHVGPLTVLVGSFPISLRPLVGAQTFAAHGYPNAIADVVCAAQKVLDSRRT